MIGAMGCDRAPVVPPTTQPGKPTVVTLVPAATDLIVAMDAEDQLLGVSNYDSSAIAEVKDLPRVGDYQNADWERLRQLRPQVMVIFHSPDRVSPGWRQNADELGIKLANITVDTIEQVLAEITHLGELLNQPAKAAVLAQELRSQLESVKLHVKDRPPVPTLILFNDKAQDTAGKGSFHDELLTIAGGVNVVQGSKWMSIDRERLLALRPEAIIVLLSDVGPQVEREARRRVEGLTDLPAVKNGRVLIVNRWYTLVPGSNLGRMTEEFARFLHPDAFPAPGSLPAVQVGGQ